jgi:hypothetical protein
MAHYALLDENDIVVQVITGKDEGTEDTDWEEFYSNETGYKVLRTSINTDGGIHYDPETGEPSEDQSKAFRFNYAGIGYKYSPTYDAFIAPKPFRTWLFDHDGYFWYPPIPCPSADYIDAETGKRWIWLDDLHELDSTKGWELDVDGEAIDPNYGLE